jgi:hypothetical protein
MKRKSQIYKVTLINGCMAALIAQYIVPEIGTIKEKKSTTSQTICIQFDKLN